MPDRAEVDDEAPGCVPPHANYPVTFQVERVFEGKPSAMGLSDPEPRAVVAISEDRQWLAVLDPEPVSQGVNQGITFWTLLRWNSKFMTWSEYEEGIRRDTGQSANEVLREFLEGRNA